MSKQQVKWLGCLCGILVVLCSFSAPAAVGSNWIEQWGIRWTFDKNISTDGAGGTYRYGTYANGDYWIVGPVKITAISPSSVSKSGRIINGSMINPIPGGPQGYDSGASGWTSSLNVAYGVSSSNPLQISVSDYPVKSLVSTISTATVPSKTSEPRLKGASVLTIVASAPSADAFRPPYCGRTKFAEIRKAHIDWNCLGNLTPVSGTPSRANSERDFERVWLDHGANYPGEVMHPEDNMPWYGREMAREVGIAMLQLNLNYPKSAKETLLYRFLQYGIDVSGVIACPEARKIWTGNGGITNGRKPAAAFAARVFNHPAMIAQHAKSGKYLNEVAGYGPGNPPPDYIHFGNEDDQVFYVSKVDVDATNSSQWHPDTRNGQLIRYTNADIGKPEWAIRHAADPWYSNNWWGTNYRDVSGCTMPAAALAGHIMGMKSVWNNPAFFDYCDRYMATIADGTPYAGKGWQWGTNGIDLYQSSRFVWNMWQTYRKNYGPVWPNTSPAPQQYTLTVSASNGTVTKSPNKSTYTAGETVTLTAVPNSGYTFTGWSGGLTGSSNPATITMNANKTVTANFSQTQTAAYTLTISASNGTVTKSPNKSTYTAGETVTLTAVPNNGYTFTGWSGGVSGTNNPVSLTMNSNKSVTASFAAAPTQGPAFYISPSGSSTNSGTSWSQAWRQLPSTLQRGATYYVAAGSYNGYTFDDPKQSVYINIVKATPEDHGANTGWQSAYGAGTAVFADLRFANTSYINFNGRYEDGFRVLSQKKTGHTVEFSGSNYINFRHVDVDANYATLNSSGNAVSHTFGACNGITILSCTDLTVANCKMHNTPDDGIQAHQSQRILIESNEIFALYGDSSGGCQAHSDGIELIGCRDVIVRGNLVYDVRSTAGIIIGDGGTASGFSYNFTVENNVFYIPESGFAGYAWSIDGLKLYGNVFWGAAYGGLSIGKDVSNMEMYNNIFSTVNYSHMGASYNAAEHLGDYNLYASSNSQYPKKAHDLMGVSPGFTNIGSAKRKVAVTDFSLVSGSPSIDAGTTVGCGFDITGAARPGGSAYDIGPFERGGGTTPQTYTLTISASNGTVTKSPNKSTYTAGETVTLTAVPNSGCIFAGWSGDASGAANPVTVTMNSNKSITAAFEAQSSASSPSLLRRVLLSLSAEQTFDGTDDYAALSTQNWNLTGATIALWFKADSTAGTRFLLGHTVGDWSNRVQLYLRDGQLNVGLGDTKALTDAVCQAGQWYYAALSWDATSYRLYLNDQLAASGTYTGLTRFNDFADLGNTGHPNVRNVEAFDGTIDDVRVFASALTPAESSSLYALGRNGSPTALFADAITRHWNAATFDGVDDYIELPTQNWNLTGTTIALWFKADSTAGTRFLFGHTVGNWSNRIQLYLRDGQLNVGLGDTKALTDAVCQAGQWYYAALSWDATSYRLYLNDQLAASGTYSGLTQLNSVADLGNTGNPNVRNVEAFSGTIDDVTVFPRVLNTAQVAALCDHGRNGGLTGHWRLADYTPAKALDSSEGQRTATLVNSPVWGRSWAGEEFIRMTAKNQAMEIPSSALRPEAGTIALWVAPESDSGTRYLFGHVLNSTNRIALMIVNGKLAVSLGDKNPIAQNLASLPVNELSHVALTWDAGQYAVFVDGLPVTTGSYTGLTQLRSACDIGNYGDPTLRTLGFLGRIEDVQTYNRALSAAEIGLRYFTHEVCENRVLAFIARAVDVLGNPISFSADDLPAGASFDVASQTFRWTPWYDQAGSHTVILRAEGQVPQPINISVQDMPLQDWYRRFLEHIGKL